MYKIIMKNLQTNDQLVETPNASVHAIEIMWLLKCFKSAKANNH